MKADNAIILAAGTSSRFAPLSYEKHKALTLVKGEILIERQIKQLKEAGLPEIIVVTGYKAEQFGYLVDKYGVKLIYNEEYKTHNNVSSIKAASHKIHNSYICSADNYFTINPFTECVDSGYYSAEYSEEYTAEWCMTENEEGYIDSVKIGGEKSWYMIGHAYWDEKFSERFLSILNEEYDLPETAGKLWEHTYMEHIDELKLRMRKYEPGVIYEFDTLDELRKYDESYIQDTRSAFVKKVASLIGTGEEKIIHICPFMSNNNTIAIGFEFDCGKKHYRYLYDTEVLIESIVKR